VVESAAASHSVWFAGEQADVAPWYSALALFCLPSLAEGISNGILEAMATGLPVVATDVGGNAELVDDGVTGKIVRDFDPSTLADAFDRYFADPGLARRQGQAGRSRAASLFNIDRMVDAYAGLYARLTNTHLPITGIEITSCAG
jgi:glycosyltransferase involved in cell wall biosynthesis